VGVVVVVRMGMGVSGNGDHGVLLLLRDALLVCGVQVHVSPVVVSDVVTGSADRPRTHGVKQRRNSPLCSEFEVQKTYATVLPITSVVVQTAHAIQNQLCLSEQL
jgi:hypothetical protein